MESKNNERNKKIEMMAMQSDSNKMMKENQYSKANNCRKILFIVIFVLLIILVEYC